MVRHFSLPGLYDMKNGSIEMTRYNQARTQKSPPFSLPRSLDQYRARGFSFLSFFPKVFFISFPHRSRSLDRSEKSELGETGSRSRFPHPDSSHTFKDSNPVSWDRKWKWTSWIERSKQRKGGKNRRWCNPKKARDKSDDDIDIRDVFFVL